MFKQSDRISSILEKGKKQWFSDNMMRANVLVAITTLRKICNHPDIYLHETGTTSEVELNFKNVDKFLNYLVLPECY